MSQVNGQNAGTAPATPIRVMILDGESNPWHDWQATTPLLRRMLEETGLFEVEVVTAPGAGEDFSAFEPEFHRHHVIVLNYDAPDGRWPASIQAGFENHVRTGAGLVVLHAANNAFPGWRAFNEMTGVGGWRGRDETAGPRWHVQEDGRLTADHGDGPAGSHGDPLPFQIRRRAAHPVTEGLPAQWMHAGDELYAGLRGPGENMTVLATAWSNPANQGTGRHEPVLMTISWGSGRVFHSTLGHDPAALASVDFVVTFQRGTEWAATGAVTQAVPRNFPDADTARRREDLLAIDTAYGAHRQP